MKKKDKNKTTIMLAIILFSVSIIMIVILYRIENKNSINLDNISSEKDEYLSVKYEDGNFIKSNDTGKIVKKISVTNISKEDIYYSITYSANSDNKEEDRYKIESVCKKSIDGIIEGDCANINELSLLRFTKIGILIEKGVTHEYTFNINIKDTKKIKDFEGSFKIKKSNISNVTYSPDGEKYYSESGTGTLKVE